MNIFKVIASGQDSFKETNASAILAWLLHPEMEHGLGYTFLSRFINEIIPPDNSELTELAKKLKHNFRGELESKNKLWLDLEKYVDTSRIDIIIGFENWVFALENKIYSRSFQTGQLKREYQGLKSHENLKNSKFGMIYLVPVSEGSETNEEKFEKEFDGFLVDGKDFKKIITWQKNRIDNTNSISDILSNILLDEVEGKIDPISEYTRHTLKALLSFIANDFSGYEYERGPSSSGLNPLSEKKRLKYDDLINENDIFVGVKGGRRGLLQMQPNELRNYGFQYSKQNMTNKRNWMHVDEFKKLAAWILNKDKPTIEWEGKFPADILYKISKDYGSYVFIGIKGGESALNSMSSSDIKNKEWQVGTEKATSQWIPGDKFKEILEKKQVF